MRLFNLPPILTVALIPFVVFIFGACSSSSVRTDGKNAIPLEDFFKNPPQAGFEISPDGKFISFSAPYQGRMNVFVQPRDLSAPAERVTDVTDRDISLHIWKGDSTILYLRDFAGDENFQLFSVNLKTHKSVALTPFAKVRTEMIDDLADIDDNHVLVGLNKRKPEIFDAYRLDVRTGELQMIAENPGNIAGWMTDHEGRLKLAITSDGVNNSILVREKENGKFHSLLTTNFKESVAPLFFTFDNKNVYASSNRGRDK